MNSTTTSGGKTRKAKDRHSQVSEHYIVRVYRRAKDDPKAIDGVVEVVEEARSVAFHDIGTLCNTILEKGRKPADGE